MTNTLSSVQQPTEAARHAAFRPIFVLAAAFIAVSAAMIAALVSLSIAGVGIDSAVWSRCSAVFASSIVLLAVASRAAKGSSGALRRLRIITPIVVLAVAVIISIPGFLPGWVRIEQGVCGALVLPVAIMVNLPRIRDHFPPFDKLRDRTSPAA